MSIEVMNCVWKHAPVQSGEFAVLLALADYADEQGSCFPSIPVLARKARLKERQTQNCIRSLVEEGFVRVEPGAGPKGCNRYVVDTEAIEARSICRHHAAPQAGGANIAPLQSATEGVQSDAPGGAMECAGGCNGVHPNHQGTTIEPSSESPEREAREDDPKRAEAAFWRLVKDWPGFAGMPKEPAKRAFMALTPEERAEAEQKFPAWLALLKAQKKAHTPAPSTYFGERLFRDVPEPQAERPAAIEAPPFGPLWGAVRLRDLVTVEPKAAPPPTSRFIAEMIARDDEAGRAERMRRQAAYGWPSVNLRDEMAGRRKGFVARPEDEWLAGLMEPVPVGSGQWDAWRAEHERRGWPWVPEPGLQRVVYFPRGGPEGLAAFERAVREGVGEGMQASEAAE